MPRRAHVILGTDETETVATADFMAYFRRLRERFLEVAEADEYPTYPDRVRHCDICDWKARCDAQRERDDYLGLVAGVRRDQIPKLAAAGAGTLTALGRSTDELAPKRMRPETVTPAAQPGAAAAARARDRRRRARAASARRRRRPEPAAGAVRGRRLLRHRGRPVRRRGPRVPVRRRVPARTASGSTGPSGATTRTRSGARSRRRSTS